MAVPIEKCRLSNIYATWSHVAPYLFTKNDCSTCEKVITINCVQEFVYCYSTENVGMCSLITIPTSISFFLVQE